MTAGQATIAEALRYAWGLLRVNWRRIWGALALNGLAYTVMAAGAFAFNPTVMLVGWLSCLFSTVLMYGALYRAAFASQHPADPAFPPAHYGVQWRRPEWRLMGVSLLVGVFTSFMVVLGVLVWGAVLSGVLQAKGVKAQDAMTTAQVAAALGPGAFSLACSCLLALVLLAVFIGVRLSLSWAATVNEDGVRVLRTWNMTRGRFWQIFVAWLIIGLPFTFLIAPIAQAILIAGGASTDSQAEVTALKANMHPQVAGPNAILAAALLMGGAMGCLAEPLRAGVTAFFYLAANGRLPSTRLPSTRLTDTR